MVLRIILGVTILLLALQVSAKNECQLRELGRRPEVISSKEYGNCKIEKARSFECYCSRDFADSWISQRHHRWGYIPPAPNASGCIAHKWRETSPKYFILQQDSAGDYIYYAQFVETSSEAIKLVDKCDNELNSSSKPEDSVINKSFEEKALK